ncbi:hypothetical protein M6B38_187055 [Iris pallida]|uniref:Uncharacterized protein n=1 Tax=Iris pallida TaxID=29817 RepID=A0AAX6EJW0_IRIPA|nr:hypothetical protein M6B38_187055 [Iris pallida]
MFVSVRVQHWLCQTLGLYVRGSWYRGFSVGAREEQLMLYYSRATKPRQVCLLILYHLGSEPEDGGVSISGWT